MTVGHEVVDGKPFLRFWFRTTGCTYDRQGLCTMCNYGEGDHLPDTIVDDLRAAVEAADIGTDATVLVSPSGCMFDPREVPDHVRRELLSVVAESRARTVLCETRPETVTHARMEEFARILGSKAGAVELGLESANAWVLRSLVNKKLDLERFRAAVDVCHDVGLRVLANVSLGTAMLSPSHAIRDSIQAVRWALGAGVDACVVFPLQVRDWTLLGWLWRNGRYEPVSLWSLVDVLRTVGREFPGRVSTAWYRDYNAMDGAASASMPVLASPTTCPDCLGAVLQALDVYRGTSDPAVLDRLVSAGCRCRTEWQRTLDAPPVDVPATYEAVGRGVLGDSWWSAHGSAVLQELQDGVAIG